MSYRLRALGCLIVLASLPARAAETYEFYDGIRPLGMGGAGLASVNDETALLINPAALGKLRDHFVTIFDPEVDLGTNTATLVGTDVAGAGDPQATLNKLNLHQDRHLHERAQVFPSIVTQHFGIGAFAKQTVDAEVVGGGNYLFDYRADTAGVLGFSVGRGGGVFKLGAVGRLINRREVQRDDLATNATNLSLTTLAREGVGLAADVGVTLSAPVTYLPTLALVWRDLGQTSFTMAKGLSHPTAARPAMIANTLDAAFAIYPILNGAWRATWTAQFDDVLNAGRDPLSHVHAGAEFNFADSVFLRAGLNQRYWTAGLELAYVGYQLQFASYGEEIGTAAKPREDRRVTAKVSLRF